jgi:Family of unknown function (DUF5343)
MAPYQGGNVQGRQRRLTEERLPPYVSYRAWQKLLGELSKHPTSRFDTSYFNGLKITKSSSSMLRGTLLFLDLMDTKGQPTSKLNDLLKSEGEAQREILAEIVRRAYGSFFSHLDLTKATQAQVKEHFKLRGASGDIGRKCLSFFLAIAAEGNVTLSPHLMKSSPRGGGKKAASSDMPRVVKSAELVANPALVGMFLEKFPNFDPEWPDEVKKKWFDGFKQLKSALLETSIPGRKPSHRR